MSPVRAMRSGFTLIELLVVVAIMAIISAVLLLSMGLLGDDRALTDQARRLGSLIELAEDEALMQGRDFGLEILQSGYRFVEYDAFRDQWLEIVDDDLLRPRQLDEGMTFELILEDRPVELDVRAAEIEEEKDEDEGEDPTDFGNDDDDDDEEDYLPHVLILSSGDTTPFNLRILRESDRAEVMLAMTPIGEIKIRKPDDDSL